MSIDDSGYTPTYTGAFNFVNGASQSNEYTYDKNGNLTKDLNKNISSIQYNFLNLPANITYSSGKSAAYIYDANGQKLRTSYKASASATAVPTDYCGNMIYENGVLKQVLVDGGYMTVTGTPFYFYYLKDHLGSNRVMVSPVGTATQINHYYPFGGLFGESTGNTGQRYKYNGKEFDRTNGVDWYDYGARHMTPDAGRFTTIDPMAEKYYNISPYAYCANNPIKYVDNDGMKFDLSSMTDEELEHYNNAIKMLQDNSSLFSKLYETLDISDNVYTINLGNPISSSNNIAIEGQFISNDLGGGEIILSRNKLINGVLQNTTFAEEYFHAYQHENASFYNNGSFNREFEAKVFATAVGLKSSGVGRYGGMSVFQDKIVNGMYGSTLQPLSPQIVNSPAFQNDYISGANSYAQYNIMNNIGNINYRISTTVSPYSLIKIVNSAYK